MSLIIFSLGFEFSYLTGGDMTPKKLRAAMMVDPCPTHKDECPIPKKGRKKPCQWGHSAFEFGDLCEHCAVKFLAALKNPYSFAQRMHHQKSRA